MFKILIVDDEAEKIRRILKVLGNVITLNVDDVQTVIDANDAKIRIKEEHFDLLILDIAIPLKKSQEIDPIGGVILLKEILSREEYKIPSHIIGLTAQADAFTAAQTEFNENLLSIIKFEENSDDWESSLLTGIQHRVSSKNSKTLVIDDYNYDVAIVCALQSELDANLNNGWDWDVLDISHDDTIYYEGKIPGNNNIRMIAACAFRMGMPAATTLTTKMIQFFRPKFCIMTGIMAGVSDKTKLGDVIVGNPVWDWGSGKWVSETDTTEDVKTSSIFQIEPYQYRLDTSISKIITLLRKDEQFLFDVRKKFNGKGPSHDISLLDGPVASGASVLANKEKFGEILGQHRKLLGIEMESYGVLCAADSISRPKPIAFSLKTVVDYGDKEKSDDFQDFGCYASAKVAQKIIEELLLN